MTAKPIEKPEEIESVSPSYSEILRQSIQAKSLGMEYIAGCGYRKALEHLIKDYLILKQPDSRDDIENKSLGNCIEYYVDDIKIKKCAKRAAWLGNDAVHYKRKWHNKDIDDLVVLLRLTEAWVESNMLTEKYEESMNTRR